MRTTITLVVAAINLTVLTPRSQAGRLKVADDNLKPIHLEASVKASVDEAFAAWTTNKGAASFISPHTNIDPRVGGAFEIYFNGEAEPGHQGSEGCRIMAIEPGKMLSFSWNAPPTRVTLDHMGWGEGVEWAKVHAYFEDAWPRVLGSMTKRFDSGPISWGEVKPRKRNSSFIYLIHPARDGFIENSTAEEQKIVGEHFAYLQRAVKDGKVVLAGRLMEAPWTGLVIFTGKDKVEADAFTSSDPAVKAGVFKAVTHPFGLALIR
jgi:uncharacterized protein YndB with AHSA1/START domain